MLVKRPPSAGKLLSGRCSRRTLSRRNARLVGLFSGHWGPAVGFFAAASTWATMREYRGGLASRLTGRSDTKREAGPVEHRF
jgi:hypothetical protein